MMVSGIDYQRQGETIITWCEAATGVDLALSFQEVQPCNEVWDQINASKNELQAAADANYVEVFIIIYHM